MTVLFHLDNPEKFSVFVDGKVRAEIKKADGRWLLRRYDHGVASSGAGTDVTRWILDQNELQRMVQAHLNGG